MNTLDTVNSRVAAFSDWAPTVLRLGAGIVFLVYGTGKIFGVGPQGVGIEGFTGFLSMLGVPAPGRLSLDHLVLDTEPTPVPASASGYEG